MSSFMQNVLHPSRYAAPRLAPPGAPMSQVGQHRQVMRGFGATPPPKASLHPHTVEEARALWSPPSAYVPPLPPGTPAATPESKTGLYVGITLGVLVLGVGGYLLFVKD